MPNDVENTMLRRSLRSPIAVKTNKRALEECSTVDRMTRSKVLHKDWASMMGPLPVLELFDEVDEKAEDEEADADFVPEAESDSDVVDEEFEEGDVTVERGELSYEVDVAAKPADASLLAELAGAEAEADADEEDDEFAPEEYAPRQRHAA